MGFDKRW
ncbi:hypothetical protein CISIN_1g0477132mg, partial [Citrus sinensis]